MTLHLAEFRRAVRAFRAERLPGMRAYYRAAAASAAGERVTWKRYRYAPPIIGQAR